MSGEPTHYDTLGVAPDASPQEVRRAYLTLARAHHPDFHVADAPQQQEAAAQKMRDINAAWEVLGNPHHRGTYDRHAASAQQASTRKVPTGPSEAELAARRREAKAARRKEMFPSLLLATALACFGVGLLTGQMIATLVGFAAALVGGAMFVLANRGSTPEQPA